MLGTFGKCRNGVGLWRAVAVAVAVTFLARAVTCTLGCIFPMLSVAVLVRMLSI